MFKTLNGIFMLIALFVVAFMASDLFKELDRAHRLYIVGAFFCSAIPAFIMAHVDGFRTGLGFRLNLKCEVIDSVEQKAIAADREEYLAVHAAMDANMVPREKDGTIMTLWGRLSIWRNEIVPSAETPIGSVVEEYECVVMALDEKKVPCQQDGKPLSLWGRIQEYKIVPGYC